MPMQSSVLYRDSIIAELERQIEEEERKEKEAKKQENAENEQR